MKTFVLRRLALLVFVLLGVSLLTFFISHVVPGDPARLAAGAHATGKQVEALRQKLGLDRPLPDQYLRYMGALLRGDLGYALSSRRPVTIESDVDFCMIQAKDKAGNVTTEAKDKAGNVTTEVEDKPVATVVVYKKGTGGTWKSKEFKIKVGEEIGRNDKLVKKTDFSTNAVCVDIDFNRVVGGKKDVALVYLDTGSGALRERLLSLDRKRDSELRKKVSKP